MPKKGGAKRKGGGFLGLSSHALAMGGCVAVLVAALVMAYVWGNVEPEGAAVSKPKEDGMGPGSMAGSAGLLNVLMKLLGEVQEAKDEDRVQVGIRVEGQLADIEKQIVVGSAAAEQQMGLISLVRSALQSDRDPGSSDVNEDWSDEALLKKHGVATYASQTYWDKAYSGGRYGASFDWYGGWEDPDLEGRSLAELVRPFVRKDARILVLGCGNSNLSAQMYNEGFGDITSVDISEPVIEQMKQTYSHIPGMKWHAMDASAMKFPDGHFDFTIEKGLFDALFAGTGSQVGAVFREMRRVLKPEGRLVSVSFSGDRIERLFQRGAGDDEEAPTGDPAKCDVAGQLKYKKEDRQDGKPHQAFYVYACQEPR